jgi:Uma2 family endonuclease
LTNLLTAMRWTLADLVLFPDDNRRYEIIDGALHISGPPRCEHSWAADGCVAALHVWDPNQQRGFASSRLQVIFTQSDAVIPDVVWVSRERFPLVWSQEDGHLHAAPDLVIEVLSPGTKNQQRDRDTKLKLYSVWGVAEYWIVDWQAERVMVYRRQDARLQLAATLQPGDSLTSPMLPGFALPVARLFVRHP